LAGYEYPIEEVIVVDSEKRVYEVLDELNISYKVVDHPAVFTSAEAEHFRDLFEDSRCKNLFLRNEKGTRHYLVIIDQSKKVDLKKLAYSMGEKQLKFASSRRLLKYLGLTPGSVSVFGLVNDSDHEVRVVLDAQLQEEEKINFHPNVNTRTLTILYDDLLKFLRWTQNRVIIQEL
jgi:Ala-tRNA(Pro) deacylase